MSTPTAVHPASMPLLQSAGSRPEPVPPGCVALLSQWLEGTADDPAMLPPPLPTLLPLHAVAYHQWHEGGIDDTGPGLLALHRWSVRVAGNPDTGTRVASETYLDVRDRLAAVVDAVERGARHIDLRTPAPEPRANVWRYHRIQARFRIQGRWRRERAHDLYDDGLQARTDTHEGQVQARTFALPLFVASAWFRADAEHMNRSPGWWWSALLHGLRMREVALAPAQRNDPTEAALRLRVRLAACTGLSRWLRRQARTRPAWNQVQLALPEAGATAPDPAMIALLDRVRSALASAIATIASSEDEQRTLHRILVQSRTVRTQLRHFAGDDATARRARMMDLAEAAGAAASFRLLAEDGQGDGMHGTGGGGSGGSGGGGRDPHAAARATMRQLSLGRMLPEAELRSFFSHLQGCPHCTDAWTATCEVADLQDHILASAQAPRPTPRRALAWSGALVLAAAALTVVVTRPTEPDVGLRGATVADALTMDLFVLRAGAAEAERLDASLPLAVGDQVYFRVAAVHGTGPGTVWVDGPDGRTEVGRVPAPTSGTWLEGSGGRQFYAFDRPGEHTFFVTPEADGTCPPERCRSVTVHVAR